ncbi:MAG: outer membrane protein transport protein [Bacteroidetes bacterium]|nr:outer membrane protein transport protein [Bacteroidota bacterium]
MKSIIVCALLLLFVSKETQAQQVEDAVRIANSNGTISSRAAALGISYAGIADDYSALYYNPAGLSLLAKREFSIGLEYLRTSTTSDFFQVGSSIGSSIVSPTNCGMVFPFKTKVGTAAIALGYNYESSLDNTLQFDGFNPSSSIVQSLVNETSDLKTNLAYQVSIADTKGSGKLHSPIVGNVQQTGFITERGGIHNLTGGGAISLSESFSVGLNIAGKWGSFKYDREYKEFDKNNIYNYWDTLNFNNSDFSSLTLNENIDQQISGISATVGLQGRFGDAFRFGVTIKSPTLYHIDENSSRSISATFDDSTTLKPIYPSSSGSFAQNNSYEIITPFVFGLGFSYHLEGLTVSTAAEYNDLTQLHFSHGQPELIRLNTNILRTLAGILTYGLGAEYEIPTTSLILRASYTGITSSYANSSESTKIFGVGCGIYVAPNVRLDFATRFSSYSQTRSNYGETGSFVNYKFSPTQVSAQLTYRY